MSDRHRLQCLEENNSIILEDVRITWTGDETNLQGFFKLTKTQKKQWRLEFDLSNCFLCIRLRDQKPEDSESDAKQILDLQGSLPFTWVAHAVTTKPKKPKNGDNQNKITFKITKISIGYIPPRFLNRKQTSPLRSFQKNSIFVSDVSSCRCISDLYTIKHILMQSFAAQGTCDWKPKRLITWWRCRHWKTS